MSKSTLSINFVGQLFPPDGQLWGTRTAEVPCLIPESFNFKFGGRTLTAEISDTSKAGFADSYVYRVEYDGDAHPTTDEFSAADAHATAILSTIKSTLGITGPVPPGSPLPAIALAYEAECATHAAGLRALDSLPRDIHGLTGIAGNHPSDESPLGTPFSPAARMLAKYVEHVFEQAAKAVAQ